MPWLSLMMSRPTPPSQRTCLAGVAHREIGVTQPTHLAIARQPDAVLERGPLAAPHSLNAVEDGLAILGQDQIERPIMLSSCSAV